MQMTKNTIHHRHSPSFLAVLSVFGCCVVVLFYFHSLGTVVSVSSNNNYKDLVPSKGNDNPEASTAANTTYTEKRPKLKTLIRKNKVIGDVQFLLDFAILGVAKCGTTTIRDWLCGHPEAQCPFKEVNDLSNGKPAWLVERLYELPKGNYKRGYKSPKEFAFEDPSSQENAMKYLANYWPETKVMIGLRHPGTLGVHYRTPYRFAL